MDPNITFNKKRFLRPINKRPLNGNFGFQQDKKEYINSTGQHLTRLSPLQGENSEINNYPNTLQNSNSHLNSHRDGRLNKSPIKNQMTSTPQQKIFRFIPQNSYSLMDQLNYKDKIDLQTLEEIINQIVNYQIFSNQMVIQLSFNYAEKYIGDNVKNILEQTMKQLMNREILRQQSKAKIAYQFLNICFLIINLFYKKMTNVMDKVGINPFIQLNKMNKNILEYVKSKYPRNKNLFVSHELKSKFTEINFSSMMENNIITNSGFCFSEPMSRSQTLGKLKKFINALIDEVNQHYDKFSSLLREQIFKSKTDGDIKMNKIKIGRKIPENVQKYFDFQSENMDINSPQIFRVMIKWIQQLENLLKAPSDSINDRQGIKYYKKYNEQRTQYFQIRSKRFQEIKATIIQKISQIKSYKKQFQVLINKLDFFNHNLIKTLISRNSSFHFLRNNQVQILKFSKFDTDFLEWLIVQKFLIIVRTFSDLTLEFKKTHFKKIDFINFKVFDLMRASFSGTKSQILQVFENLKKQERQKQITFVRIKDRLNTPLNDVMINFKLKDSFVICQLQLILVDLLQLGEYKFKIMQNLNHIIYELERSPYGSISEMSLIIDYNDPSVQYGDKIQFNPEWPLKSECQGGKQHEFQEISFQDTPFVCSWCMKFYTRLENFFQYYKCTNCSLQKCKSCLFLENKGEQRKVYFKYLASCILNMSIERINTHQDEEFIQNLFAAYVGPLDFLSENYIRLRDEIKIGKTSKIRSLQKILYKTKLASQLSSTQSLYSLLLHFEDGKCSIHVIEYANYVVKNCSQNQNDQKILLGQHDVLFFLSKRIYKKKVQKAGQKSQQRSFQLKHEFVNQNKVMNFVDIRTGLKYANKYNKYEVTYIQMAKKNKNYLLKIEYLNDELSQVQLPKISQNSTFEAVIKKHEEYSLSKTSMNLSKTGVNQNFIDKVIQLQWSKQIKILNIENNNIKSMDMILMSTTFVSLEEIAAGHNLIQKIRIPDQINILVLDFQFNQLLELPEEINNLHKITFLSCSDNKIKSIPLLKLAYLQQFNLKNNNITQFDNLVHSELPALQILDISNNQCEQNPKWFEDLQFVTLKKLQMKQINLKIKEKMSFKKMRQIQYIDLSGNPLQRFQKFDQKEIRQLRLNNCMLQDIQKVFSSKLIYLSVLNLNNNLIIKLPKLQLDNLSQLYIKSNKLEDIDSLKQSYLPVLKLLDFGNNKIINIHVLSQTQFPEIKEINLSHNKIQKLPTLNFSNLISLNLLRNSINDCSEFSQSKIPNLSKLLLKSNQIKYIPKLIFPNLQNFTISENKIQNIQQFAESELSNWSKVYLHMNRLSQIPVLNFPKAQILYLYSNKLVNVSSLTNSNLINLKQLSLFKNKITTLPILKLKSLQNVYLYNNLLEDISAISQWECKELKLLIINYNKIVDLPGMKFPKLIDIEACSNKIQDLTQFCKSQLPLLTKVMLTSNKISVLKKMEHMAKLIDLKLGNNLLQDISEWAQKSNLPKLKKLDLNINKIQTLPQFNLPNLEELFVRRNKIKVFENAQTVLSSKLRNFYITNNLVQIFPSALLLGCKLEQVSLSKNKWTSLQLNPQLLIKKLLLVNSGITDDLINQLYLPCVEQINLTSNQITSLNFLNDTGGFQTLKKITLIDNQITTLCSVQLPQLTHLYLSENPITQYNQFFNSQIPKIKEISILKTKLKPQTKVSSAQPKLTVINENENQNQNQNEKKLKPIEQQLVNEKVSQRYMYEDEIKKTQALMKKSKKYSKPTNSEDKLGSMGAMQSQIQSESSSDQEGLKLTFIKRTASILTNSILQNEKASLVNKLRQTFKTLAIVI